MVRFNASSLSSRFVFVCTVVLILLAMIINIYPAAAASLEAVEEVAKDQGTTEVASVHHHEIRERVLLGAAVGKFFGKMWKSTFGRVTNAKPRLQSSPRTQTPSLNWPSRSPRKPLDVTGLYQNLDNSCPTLYYYMQPSYVGGSYVGRSCLYGEKYLPEYIPCAPNVVRYCCEGIMNIACNLCCKREGTNGPRTGIIFP